MIIKKQDGKIVFEPRIFVSRVKGDVLSNGALLYAEVDGNAKVNLSGLVGAVDGNAKVNFGGLVGAVDGNAGVNLSGLYAEVCENAKVNFGGLVGEVCKSHDYTIGDIDLRIIKYLPEFIKKINLPAINFGGVYTNTGDPYNSFILGLFNNIKDTRNDYFALGLVNRITGEDGKKRSSLFCSGRIHIDGFFRHRNNKNLDAKAEEEK